MLKYLILVIQNLTVPAILAALVFSAASRENQGRRKKTAAVSMAAGAACALVLAVLRRVTVYVNREYVNIAVLFVAFAAGSVFIFSILRNLKKTGAGDSSAAAEKIFLASLALLPAALLFYALPTVFLYPTGFVLPGESVFSTDFLFKFTGYICGILAVALSGVALFYTASRLSAKLTGIFLCAGLALTMLNQLATIIQFLLARRLIPMPRWLFGLIILIINYNDFFLYGLLAISCVLPLVLYIKSRRPGESGANPAQRRKIRAALRSRKRWSAAVIAGFLFAVLSLTALKAYDEQEVVLSPAEPMTIKDGEVLVALDTIMDGRLHRYEYTAADGAQMRFIIIRKNESAFGVGLDACDICGPTGYYERDSEVICKLCDVVMNKQTIGFKGGCNPVPLAYTLRGGNMVIKTEDLEKESGRFAA
ncbi:MAG: Fe-S-containing protein [Spirochaetia bacterium]|jgi:uncharacterized membrane protein|nr:Fe-S-containing protein [Spirochaetia bacterium]